MRVPNARPISVRGALGFEPTLDTCTETSTWTHVKARLPRCGDETEAGKTALLLTLAGRMKPTAGTLRVGGFELPRERAKAERHVGLGLFKGLNDLQENLSAARAAQAEFELHGLDSRRESADYLRAWGLADVMEIRVKDLTSEKLAQLGIALAFVGEPDAVAVDDVEDQLTTSQSRGLMELLSRAAREHDAAVVVGVVERELACRADACVYVAKEGE